jgi:hypothetical protein
VTIIASQRKLFVVHARNTRVCMRALSFHIRTWQISIRACFGFSAKMPYIVWWKTCVFLKLKALISAGNIAPEEALHIGDSLVKDYEADKSTGMLALSLGRFKTPEAVESRNSGAVVLPDLSNTRMTVFKEVNLLEALYLCWITYCVLYHSGRYHNCMCLNIDLQSHDWGYL